MMRRFGSRLLLWVACAATALLVAGFVMRFTVRDTIRVLQLVFYTTPWPVLALLAGLLAGYWRWVGARVLSALFAVASLGALLGWGVEDWKWASQPNRRGDLRVVQWNVDRPNWRFDGDARWLAAQDADIMTIAEREPRKTNTRDRWQTAFADYQLVPSKGEMLCLVRGEIVSVQEGLLHGECFRTLIRARVRGRDLTVLQVDFNGYPPASRAVPWKKLTELVGTLRNEPLLVAGDFNTPLDSAHVAPLRAEAANAFEAAGRGCVSTWPMPFPVLSLDQMWTNARLRAVRCENHGSWRSDHRAMVAEFDFAP
jgi:endonuclease/exonuclease/phosphatase (EEP) superfamily protein YafD